METTRIEQDIKLIYEEMSDLLHQKNVSYGYSALKGEGIMPLIGNMVRLGDKMRRYEHIIETAINNGGKLESCFDESLEDTLKDILGYATLGLLAYHHYVNEPMKSTVTSAEEISRALEKRYYESGYDRPVRGIVETSFG